MSAATGTTEVRMLGKGEITKDAIQVGVESAATHVGQIATIITGAVRDVAKEIGDFATDMYEMADSTRRARAARGEATGTGTSDD